MTAFCFNMKKDSSKKITDLIYEIQKNIGSRIAGSSEEKMASRVIKNIFEDNCKNILFDPFYCNPRSIQNEIVFSCVVYCLSLLGYIVYPIFAPIILLFYFFNFYLIKFFDIRFSDIFVKKSKSHNLIAKYGDNDKAKTIIFTANIDSPYFMKLYSSSIRKYSLKLKEYFNVSFIILFIISVIKVLNIIPFFDDYIYLLPFMLIALIVFFYDNTVSYEKTLGANNNLSGVSVLAHLSEHLKELDLKNVNVWLCVFGAKNANLAGSKFFVNKYFKEIKNSEVINITSVSGDNLYIITRENYFKLNNNINLVDFIYKTSENIGIKLYRNFINIDTDSAPFSYEKIPSTTITSLDKDLIPLRYNIIDDLPQYIKEEQLVNVFNICKEIIRVKNG